MKKIIKLVALCALIALNINIFDNKNIESVYAAEDPWVWCYHLKPDGPLAGWDCANYWVSGFIQTCTYRTNQQLENENSVKCFITSNIPPETGDIN